MRRLEAHDDADLLGLAHVDGDAFAVFYRRHARALLIFVTRRAGSPETGADLTAETFATALSQAQRFDPERGDAVSWLYGIARNKLAGFHRTGAVERRARRRIGIRAIAIDDSELERIERLASLDVSAAVLERVLDELPAAQRAAVVARVVHEHSYAEIGEAAAVTPVVARQRVSRGLAALRHRLGGQS